MTSLSNLIAATVLLLAVSADSISAKEPTKDTVRDGSTEAKAIVVFVSSAQSHEWQIAYLKKHFPEHYSITGPLSNLNQEHAFIAHEKQDKFFDYYSFTIRGQKVEVYFDISKQVKEEFEQSRDGRK